MKIFRLYGTSACHLCELALAMVEDRRSPLDDFRIEQLDISESDDLFARYGLRIPVLQHPDARELDWPFSPQQLEDFLAS